MKMKTQLSTWWKSAKERQHLKRYCNKCLGACRFQRLQTAKNYKYKHMLAKTGHKIGCFKNALKWMCCQLVQWDRERKRDRERDLPLSVVSSEVCQWVFCCVFTTHVAVLSTHMTCLRGRMLPLCFSTCCVFFFFHF